MRTPPPPKILWTNQSRFTFRFDTGTIGHTLVTGIELSREETLNRQRVFTECAELPCTGATDIQKTA